MTEYRVPAGVWTADQDISVAQYDAFTAWFSQPNAVPFEDTLRTGWVEVEGVRWTWTPSTPDRARADIRWDGLSNAVWCHSQTHDEIRVPYLARGVDEQGVTTSLILDDRLMYVLPDGLTEDQKLDLAHFLADAIAIGAGYPSISYTKRKLPFRG